MISIYHLPLLNSILNSISAIFLIIGFVYIKKGNVKAHLRAMWSAFTVSALFLVSYLIFHYLVGSVGFDGQGMIVPVYYFILITHIILAMVILPLVLITLYRATRGDFNRHRNIARWTWPLWLYVSVTGVLVYLMMVATGSYDKIL